MSIGICAYNEERNIGKLLSSLSEQKTDIVSIKEIIVVSSASTDRTDEIVREYAKRDERVKLITQQERRGKIAALNELLKAARGEVVVLISADTIPIEDTIESLCTPFLSPKTGIVGGRAVPVDSPDTLCGFITNLTWELHHEVSVKHPSNPKIGEIYAFRNIIEKLPQNTLTDEDTMRMLVQGRGYGAAYAPHAIVYNKGPDTLAELIRQRKRWNISQALLTKTAGFDNPGWKHIDIVKLTLRKLKPNPKSMAWLFLASILEVYIRVYSLYYVHTQIKKPEKFRAIFCWEQVESTKDVKRR